MRSSVDEGTTEADVTQSVDHGTFGLVAFPPERRLKKPVHTRHFLDAKSAAMDLRQLKSFIAVAEELHIRRAAERLGLAQTALSSQVRSLEEELGFPLLFRTTRHVSLTQAGAVFLDEARAVLERLDAGVERASIAASQGLNRLRLGGIDAALAARTRCRLTTCKARS